MDILFGLAFSTHLGLEGNYNELHPNVRLQTEQYIAGAYYNSDERISLFLGKEYKFDKLGIELGAVTGYEAYDTLLVPMARATYELSEQHKFFVAPAYEKNSTGDNVGIVFGLDFTLN